MFDECLTGDRILLNAINLMADKGFKGVTMKEIADAAAVSEMTIFRHFGSKRKLLEEAINKYHYSAPMEKIFNEKITWNLEDDLTVISKAYQHHMRKNQKMVLLAMREKNTHSGIDEYISKHPRHLVELLVNYFTKMQEIGKVIKQDPESQAVIFLWMNFGAFISNLISGEVVSKISVEDYIRSSVRTFARGITP